MIRQISLKKFDKLEKESTPSNSDKKNLKVIFKNSVKTIKSIITLQSLKKTLVNMLHKNF